MEFLRSVLAKDEAITVSTRKTYDLPVNPLSHIIFTLLFQNDTATVSNYSMISAALNQISNISVEFKGTSILSGSLADLAVVSMLLTGKPIAQINMNRADNDVRAVSVCLPFGRRLYNPVECFPATKRGDLRLVIDYASAQTGIDTLYAQIETVELMGAQPEGFIKCTTLKKTATAAGDHDIDLPLGNPIIGVVLYAPTVPNTSYACSINTVKLKIDNSEAFYGDCNWESLQPDLYDRIPYNDMFSQHVHYYDPTGTSATSTLAQENDISILRNYAYLDFDPNLDGQFVLLTEGRSRVHLVVNTSTTDEIRVLPIEMLGIKGE